MSANMPLSKPTVLDLFSGIGGFSLGLERAGFQTVAFCEVDAKARKVLQKHWPDVPIHADVKELKGADIGYVDVICGGFPCQDISVAGKGAGLSGERSGLWFEYARLIEEIRPKAAIIENVSALRSRGLDQVLRSLAAIGYDAQWHCVPASAIGAPHQRDRIWIVANPSCRRRSGEEERKVQQSRRTETFGASEDVSDSLRQGLPWYRPESIGQNGQQSWGLFTPNSWWVTEPDVGRVVHGVPNRMDRIKQLGNAVVPQVVELIGRALLAAWGRNEK